MIRLVWCAGNSYYSSESDTTLPAGFKQYCVPIPMAPGASCRDMDIPLLYAHVTFAYAVWSRY